MLLLQSSSASNSWPRRYQLRGQAHQISVYSTLDWLRKSITWMFGGALVSASSPDDPLRVSQAKGNFNRIARDLDRAIRASHFTEVQRAVLDEARELSWSFAGIDPDPFRFNFTVMERHLGYKRESLSRQASILTRLCNVFVANEDGTLFINKDYRKWLNEDGSRRLTEEQIKWCIEIIRKGRTVTAGSRARDRTVTPTVTPESQCTSVNCDPTVTPTVIARSHSCDRTVTPPVIAGSHPDDPPPGPPYRTRAPELEREREKERVERECVKDTHTHAGTGRRVGREPEDLALIRQAERMLAVDLRTEHIAMEIGRNHNLPEALQLEGWRWVKAAERILSPTLDNAKRSWPYFYQTVKKLSDAERHEQPAAPKLSPAQAKHQALIEGLKQRFGRKADGVQEAKDGQG